MTSDLRLGRHLFEADGLLKYDEDPQGALREEKSRQDFLSGFKLGASRITAYDCLGGRRAALRRLGREYDDTCRRFGSSIDDLAPSEVIVAATGVSNGDLLRGVRYGADSARTHSLVMCTRCNWVRFVDGTHFFARERREEVRLL